MSARRSHRSARRFPLAVAVIGLLLAALAGATPAFAEAAAPHWKIESRAAPTNLPLEHGGTPGEGVIEVTLANLGDADVNGAEAGKEVKITDKLPAGLEATEVVGESHGNIKSETRNISPADGLRCSAAPTNPILCTFKRTLPPYEQLEIFIRVKVKLQAPSEPSNEVTVEGGGAKPESLGRKLKVNGKATAFGVEQYELAPENEDGSTDTQAGSHPYQLTTTFNLNQTLALDVFENRTEPSAPALQKNLDFALPPGLIGNANALPKCSEFDFGVHGENETNDCPAETAVGVATVTFNDPVLLLYDKATVPVFNLAPAPGEPARFGFTAARVPITLNTSVRTGGDYGVTVSVEDSSAAVQVLGSIVTIWGVPEEESHDSARGWDCLEHVTRPVEPCEQHLKFPQPAPFLSLPTSCSGPPVTSVTGTSYPNTDGEVSKIVAGEENTSYSFRSAFSGCELLDFSPTITVEPEIHEASTPTGLKVHVHVPQTTTLEAKGLAESAVKDTTVKLPSGVQLNPGAANGLEACSEEETGGYEQEGRHVQGGVGFTGSQELEPESEKGARTDTFTEKLPEPLEPGTNFCPNGSKVGVVHIKTPDLPNELEGGVYLARQNANPFGSLFAMYMVAQDPVSKVLVKLAGEVHVSETGQITSTFKNTPDVAFEELTLELFGGPRASLSTPPSCGTYTPEAAFTPWSSTKEEEHKPPVEPFKITSGQGGGGCPPSPLSFSPSVQAGTTNNQAGQYTPFTLTISKPDGQQALE